MRPLSDLIVALVEPLLFQVGTSGPEAELAVTSLELDLPLEARLEHGAELRASLPRGRMATGFQLPHGRLFARVTAERRERE